MTRIFSQVVTVLVCVGGIVWATDSETPMSGASVKEPPLPQDGSRAVRGTFRGTPPKMDGEKQRFVIIEGVGQNGARAMYRMDSFTGETWKLNEWWLESGDKTKMKFDMWGRVDEVDSDMNRLLIQQVEARLQNPPARKGR